MSTNHEKEYQALLVNLIENLPTKLDGLYTVSEIAEDIRPLFDTIIGIIDANQETLGDDQNEFAEALCMETSFLLLESLDLIPLSLDLPLISRFIAGESAVAYSISGVVDVLDEENRINRIAAAFLGGLLYLIIVGKRSQRLQNP